MEEKLREPSARVVGTKQVLRALKDDRAAAVFLCKDADDFIYRQIEAACEEHHVPLHPMDGMEKLGKLCLVGVPTATAALLK